MALCTDCASPQLSAGSPSLLNALVLLNSTPDYQKKLSAKTKVEWTNTIPCMQRTHTEYARE